MQFQKHIIEYGQYGYLVGRYLIYRYRLTDHYRSDSLSSATNKFMLSHNYIIYYSDFVNIKV